MFQATPQEIKRFESVNKLLNSLTKKMYRRMANLYRALIDSPKDKSFDDDYVVRGTLKYVYGEEEYSILILPEDSFYGSDFAYMIELIYLLNEDFCLGIPEIEECSCLLYTSDAADEL